MKSTKGLTFEQARSELAQVVLETASVVFELVDIRIVEVLRGRLSSQQRHLLSDTLQFVQKFRSKAFPKDD